MIPEHILIDEIADDERAMLGASCNETNGVMEGFGGPTGELRRYGGYIIMRVRRETADTIFDLPRDEQIRELRGYFGPTDENGAMMVKDEAGVNIVRALPVEGEELAINPYKVSRMVKEYPAPQN